MRRSKKQSFPWLAYCSLFLPAFFSHSLHQLHLPYYLLIVSEFKAAVWIVMEGKQESVELGEIRARDTNQDEAALARLGKKTVLKVCASHLHAPLLSIPSF